MTERATFCPRCRKMHVGVCKSVAFGVGAPSPKQPSPRTEPPRRPLTAAESDTAVKIEAAAGESLGTATKAREAIAKFDRVAYQRELMRKRRAEAKAKAP